jgi:hypothetical protein
MHKRPGVIKSNVSKRPVLPIYSSIFRDIKSIIYGITGSGEVVSECHIKNRCAGLVVCVIPHREATGNIIN